jgi:two-component system, cell cycle response regulator DivK
MPQKSGATHPQTILVVEDYRDTREMMRIVLEEMGYRVVEAADGLEAVEVAKRERPTAILMDMGLPVMDGFETSRRIKALPELKLTTIIACSAYNRWEWRAKAIAAGCNGFLTKPLDLTRLRSLLRKSTDL